MYWSPRLAISRRVHGICPGVLWDLCGESSESRFGNADGLADHQAAGRGEEQHGEVAANESERDGTQMVGGVKPEEERQRQETRRDRRAFEVRDLAVIA